jgi:putative transposase
LNRTYREGVLDVHLFATIEDVRDPTWRFMIDYQAHRPNDGLGGMTPAEFRQQCKARLSTSELSD